MPWLIPMFFSPFPSQPFCLYLYHSSQWRVWRLYVTLWIGLIRNLHFLFLWIICNCIPYVCVYIMHTCSLYTEIYLYTHVFVHRYNYILVFCTCLEYSKIHKKLMLFMRVLLAEVFFSFSFLPLLLLSPSPSPFYSIILHVSIWSELSVFLPCPWEL